MADISWILNGELWFFTIIGGIITAAIVDSLLKFQHKLDRKKSIKYICNQFINFEQELENIKNGPIDQFRFAIFENRIKRMELIINTKSDMLNDDELISILEIIQESQGMIKLMTESKAFIFAKLCGDFFIKIEKLKWLKFKHKYEFK